MTNMLKCTNCGETFSKKWNLQRHLSNVHKETTEYRWKCDVCDKSFVTQWNLKRHKQNHNLNNPDIPYVIIEELQSNIKVQNEMNELLWEQDQTCTVGCHLCNMEFKHVYELENHKRFAHGIIITWLHCEKCKISFTTRRSFVLHLSKEHDVHVQKHFFTSEIEFDSWKHKRQLEETVIYKLVSIIRNRNGTLKRYVCNRTDYFKPKLQRIRMPLKKGSCKICASCPSHVQIIISETGVDVEYVPQHWSHSRELCHVPLPKEDTKNICGGTSTQYSLEEYPKHFMDIAKSTSASSQTDNL